ncbi:Pre-mRNA-splicing factor ATP-dependent RNA helicase PRP16 [Galdieria sulphuraria]|nr:Pre-mRNA-splicing factor ATP-dependent RNA helicase PRP16 [Galdieria sulphuraria]
MNNEYDVLKGSSASQGVEHLHTEKKTLLPEQLENKVSPAVSLVSYGETVDKNSHSREDRHSHWPRHAHKRKRLESTPSLSTESVFPGVGNRPPAISKKKPDFRTKPKLLATSDNSLLSRNKSETIRTPSRISWEGSTPKISTWDTEDPSQVDLPYLLDRNTPMTGKLPSYEDDNSRASTPVDDALYKEQEFLLEREWYLKDEEGSVMDDSSGSYLLNNNTSHVQERRAKKVSARTAALNEDSNRWENLQMRLGGGDRSQQKFDIEVDDEETVRVSLLVKDTTPPFLEGQTNWKGSLDTVLPVKDSTSDLAKIARKGSRVVQEAREQRERGQARVKYWELGTAAGAKEKEAEEAQRERQETEASLRKIQSSNDVDDYKSSMRYGNVLTGKASEREERQHSIAQQRKTLPIYGMKNDILRVVRENQIVVIVGETGSGKTTQLTQYLHEEGYSKRGIIGCTQPRRVAAVSVANRVAEEMQVELGKEVGYAIRFEDFTCEKTVIKYMTDGILLRESLSDPDLEKYSCVIMDEAHERSLNTDVLFGILKQLASRRSDLKIIVTSATLESEKFAEFFGRVPVFRIPGRTYPVDIFHSKSVVEDYVEGAVRQVLQIHLQATVPGDILVFMTGQEDIEVTCETIATRLEKLEGAKPLLILPIYSQLASDLQARIFEPAPEGTRKVVVATNIAETSLTVDGVKYVVDTGFCKLKTYNPRIGMDALLLCPVSQASASQRAGRAGRTGPGRCYRLYTEYAFSHEMLPANVPEIQRTNLGHVVLLLKSLGVSDLLHFPFMDPPPPENIVKSMLGLWFLGALDGGGRLTDLGKRMSSFPLDPPLSAMILAGERFGCSDEVVTIVSMLSVPSIFIRPPGREEEADAVREKFLVPESDHLTLLHIFQRYRSNGCRAEWCNKHFLNSKGMRKAAEVRSQLVDLMKEQGMELASCGLKWDIIRKAICAAYFHQAARMKGIGDYVNLRTSVQCYLHPSSALAGLGYNPEYVVYHELVYTGTKEYMHCVTAVEPQWLAELGPMFFTLKEGNTSRLEKQRQEQQDRLLMEQQHEEAKREKEREQAMASKLKSRNRIATPGATPRFRPWFF